MEDLDLLTEIQQGFRKGRRAEENLLVLETVLAWQTRTGRRMNAALLDITKAYDRVDRDILWQKLMDWEFPQKVINVLKAMYEGVHGVITFQGFQSGSLPLSIGLKQGCVLSPLLFALYIAELGEQLLANKTGPMIGGVQIPGLFFADDMLLFGADRDLEKALSVVGRFAETHKIEFAGHKSMVVPLTYGCADRNKKWALGRKWLSTGEEIQIQMGEEKKGTYLGVTIRRTCNNFVPFWSDKVGKANHQIRVLKEATRGMPRALGVAKKVYDTYTLPRILYGTDVARVNPPQLRKLQKCQNDMMRLALRAPNWMNIAAMNKIGGFWPIQMEIDNKKVQLWRYIQTLPDERLAKKAFNQQRDWLNSDMENQDPGTKQWTGYWAHTVQGIIQENGLSAADVSSKIRIKDRLKQRTAEAIQEQLQGTKYRWIRETGWCITEEDVSSVTPCWLWHRLRWGILEDQFLLRFPFDRMSQKVRLQSCVREWIGKRQVMLDCVEKAKTNVGQESIVADTTQNSEEDEDSEEESLEEVDLNPSDSEEEESDGRGDREEVHRTEQAQRSVEEVQRSVEEVQSSVGRICWMCGQEDSISHLLWLCPAVALGQTTLRPRPEGILEDEQDPMEVKVHRWLDWWMHRDRLREERQHFGNEVMMAFLRRRQWCIQTNTMPRTVDQMLDIERKKRMEQMGLDSQ